jgi:hypothetical protein
MSAPKTWLQSEAIAITLLIAAALVWGAVTVSSFLQNHIESAFSAAGLR